MTHLHVYDQIARGAGTFGLGQAIRRLSVALAFHEPQEEKVDKDYIVYVKDLLRAAPLPCSHYFLRFQGVETRKTCNLKMCVPTPLKAGLSFVFLLHSYSTTTDTPTLRRRRQTDSQLLGNARPLSLVNQQSLDGLDLGSNEK